MDIKRSRNVVAVKLHAKTGTFGLHFCIAWESFQTMTDLDWEPWQAGDAELRHVISHHAKQIQTLVEPNRSMTVALGETFCKKFPPTIIT
ncbi:MAG: hypothetical protein HQ592_10195, partial [Planctomycetes bacterium]|nr:hypothetical protein [Planctomycetota bacterium]